MLIPASVESLSSPKTNIADLDTVPGMIVGMKGKYLAPSITSSHPETVPHKIEHPTPLQTWGVDLASESLLGGLRAWPPNPSYDENDPPLSSLGHAADDVYKLGPLTLQEYTEQLVEFVESSFPPNSVATIRDTMLGYIKDEPDPKRWNDAKHIWQTDRNKDHVLDKTVNSWHNGPAKEEGWKWDLKTDLEADSYVEDELLHSRVAKLWRWLPSGILVSFLRKAL